MTTNQILEEVHNKFVVQIRLYAEYTLDDILKEIITVTNVRNMEQEVIKEKAICLSALWHLVGLKMTAMEDRK
jgi:hypothetical protein